MDESREPEEVKHPAFGQISFTRVNSNGQTFYGSELEQGNYINLKVFQSAMMRELTCDRYYADGRLPLIEVRMSAGQFSELITSMNMGDGVPCTIEMVNRVPVQKLEKPESRKEFVHRKFEDRMKEFAKTLKIKQAKVKELSAKKTLSKADQQELNWTVDWITQEVAKNIPFFTTCFQETIDEVVQEAKLEIENAIQHKVTVLGLNALHKENKLIELGGKKKGE